MSLLKGLTRLLFICCLFMSEFALSSNQLSSHPLNSDSSINDPELNLSQRTRWETAEVGDQRGHALTTKLRLNLAYELEDDIRSFIEFDHVVSFNDDKHSNGVVHNGRPLIADPEGTEVNQAWLKMDMFDSTATLGRQRITLGDQRFIGDVGFRQNDQTYDAIRLETGLASSSQLNIAYIHNVNRIFSNDADKHLTPEDTRFAALSGKRPLAQLGNHHLDAWLMHLVYNEIDHLEWHTYGYGIHNYHASALSNRTVGSEAIYRNKFGHYRFVLRGEMALQKQQVKQSEWLVYRKASMALGYKQFEFGLRHEYLGERDNVAFVTPLATLHKFQGWADQFLVTPSQGLRDDSFSMKWKMKPWTVDIRYHLFDSISDGQKIGEELDIDLIFQPARKHEIKIRYADFNKASNQTIKTQDVRKAFLMYSYNM